MISMSIKQIKVGFDNFSYIIYDHHSKKAAVVDTSYDIKKTVDFIESNNLILEYIISTHYHRDHTSKNKKLKQLYPDSKIVASKSDGDKLNLKVDVHVGDNDILNLGDAKLKLILTPGHTPGGICIVVDDEAIITGDTIFIDDCGRADLPGGDIKQLFESLQKIKQLPDKLIVYPGHDYGPKSFDSLSNQKKTNPTLIAKNLYEFSKIKKKIN